MDAAGGAGRDNRRLKTLVLIHEDDAGPGVFAEAIPDLAPASFALGYPPAGDLLDSCGAAIVLGGGMHVDQEDEHPWLVPEKELIGDLLERGVPTLGVCLGAQLVAEVAGARVGPLASGPEIGWFGLESSGADDPLLGPLPPSFRAFEWHSYGFETPPGAVELARSPAGSQAFRLDGAPAWGIQFHAEVTLDIVRGWIGAYGADAGIDKEALAAETEREIARWNEVGRGIAARFTAAAGS